MISHYALAAIAALSLAGRTESQIAIIPAGAPAKSLAGAMPPSADPELAPNPLWEIPLKQLPVTRDRPIFSPSRRPPPPVVAAPAPRVERVAPKPAEPERPQIALIGTIIGASERIGIFVEQGTKQVIRLKIGDDHNGWLLTSVKGREATLQKGQEVVSLDFPAPGSPPVPPATAAPNVPTTPANALPAVASASPASSASAQRTASRTASSSSATQNALSGLLQFRETLTPAADTPTATQPPDVDALRNLVRRR